MKTVYLLWYWREYEDYREESKLLGVFSTEKNALLAKEKLKDEPSFGGSKFLHIGDYLLNKDHWEEGYFTD